MNIILVGFRGSGKSTISKALAERINFRYISTDEEIKRLNKKSISRIVDEKGWDYFRKCEKDIILKIGDLENYVIDTGGGSIINETNRNNLRKAGKVVYLRANQKDLYERIQKGSDRPSLKDKMDLKQEIKTLIKERRDIYISVSDLIINTSGHSVLECINSIIKKLNLK